MNKINAINKLKEVNLYPYNDNLEVESQVVRLDDIDDDFFNNKEGKLSENGKLLGMFILIYPMILRIQIYTID